MIYFLKNKKSNHYEVLIKIKGGLLRSSIRYVNCSLIFIIYIFLYITIVEKFKSNIKKCICILTKHKNKEEVIKEI